MPALKTTSEQRRQVYATMAAAGIREKELQRDLISQYTGHRTDSATEMYQQEAISLIHAMRAARKETPENRMRKKILHYAHLVGWKTPTGQADLKAVDTWCTEYGQFHKPLREHTARELPALLSQFEKVFKTYLNNL